MGEGAIDTESGLVSRYWRYTQENPISFALIGLSFGRSQTGGKGNMQGYRNTEESFWERVDRTGECWVWTATRLPSGYGRLSWNGRPAYAHRVAFALTNGAIPSGLFVCHRCDNPPCCRPAHLFAGTGQENARDRDAKGRHPLPVRVKPYLVGEAHQNSKLTAALVVELRALYTEGQKFAPLARRVGMSVGAVTKAVRGETWGHVGSGGATRSYRTEGPSRQWSPQRPACVDCGETSRPFEAHGRCTRCYLADWKRRQGGVRHGGR